MDSNCLGNPKPISACLRVGSFTVVIQRQHDGVLVFIQDSQNGVVHTTRVRLYKEDVSRLHDWIEKLDEFNFLNAPEVAFVNLDLEFEMTFVDVDDIGATVTVFLIVSPESMAAERTYKGIRGETSRKELSQFGRELLMLCRTGF
jgi:hypothetical protein